MLQGKKNTKVVNLIMILLIEKEESYLKIIKRVWWGGSQYDKSISPLPIVDCYNYSRSAVLRHVQSSPTHQDYLFLGQDAPPCNANETQERLSVQAVRLNLDNHLFSYRFYNNLLIGKNYLAIVAQYVLLPSCSPSATSVNCPSPSV